MWPVQVRRDCYHLVCSIIPLLIVAAVSAVMASPHPKAVMDLTVYNPDEYSIPYTLASLDKPSSDFSGQGDIIESSCAPDSVQTNGKVRRAGYCVNTDVSGQVENDSSPEKTKPERTRPSAEDDDKPKPDEPSPDEKPPTEKKGDDPDPNATPDLGPLYRPLNGHEIQGPCSWPQRFLCCDDELLVVNGNVKDCWLCTYFFPPLVRFQISRREKRNFQNSIWSEYVVVQTTYLLESAWLLTRFIFTAVSIWT